MAEFKVKINDRSFDIDKVSEPGMLIDGNNIQLEVVKLKENQYSVIFKNKVFEFTIEQNSGVHYLFHHDNQSFDIEIEDETDQLLHKYKNQGQSSHRLLEVKAPMPGLVLKVEVKVGQTVTSGSGLVILEAMKMENEIRSITDGVVKEIRVKERTAIEKGDTLIILE